MFNHDVPKSAGEIQLPGIERLPRLPADWQFHGRALHYDRPHFEEWAKLLHSLQELGEAKLNR